MLTLTMIDSDRWITEGIARYFADRQILIRNIEEASIDEAYKIAAGTDVLISELTAYGRDVQYFTELLLTVRRLSPKTRIILLTDLNEEAVTGYVLNVLSGVTFLSKKRPITELASAVLGASPSTVTAPATLCTKQVLSPREFELLRLLVKTSSLTDIGHSLRLSCKTISHHRQNIIRKLNCSNSIELFSRLNRMGYHPDNT